MSDFVIKYLEKKDFDVNYFHLLGQLTTIDPHKITEEDFNKFIDKLNENHFIKVIKTTSTNKIIGSITILKEEKIIHNFGKVGHIEDVVVDSSFRGFGLGKKLIDIALEEMNDCYKVILDCSAHNVAFYEKCGFENKGNYMCKYL